MTVRICVAKFANPIILGNGVNSKEIDLRGPSRQKPLIESMTYDPSNGEVVIMPTKLCNVTKGQRQAFRVPGSNVVHVIEEDVTPDPKAKPAKVAEKPAVIA